MPFATRFANHLTAASLSVLLAHSLGAYAQPSTKTPCVVEDMQYPMMPACVIQTRNGDLYIPKKYWMYPNFNRYGLAAFTIPTFGRVYVNRSGRIIIRNVALMDNFPDDFHHGLVRINHDNLWGYADPSGRIVVPVKYSCALNFKDKYDDIGPLVCEGCRIERQGEYQGCVDGKWFHVDVRGKLEPSARPLSAKPRTP